jgi:hypothetical protein
MAFNDLSHLPTGPSGDGNPPTDTAVVASALATAWAEDQVDKAVRPLEADADRTYYSMAGRCARAISYEVRRRDALIAYVGPRWIVVNNNTGRAADQTEHDTMAEAQIEVDDDPEKWVVHPHPDYVRWALSVEDALGPEPFDESSEWNFRLGTASHDIVQAAIAATLPGARLEVESRIDAVSMHGRSDATWTYAVADDDHVSGTEAIEIKSKGGWGYKMAAGYAKKSEPPEGPRFSDVLQGALGAYGAGADRLRIVIVGRENVSESHFARFGGGNHMRRFIAEWVYDHDQIAAIIKPELERIAKILAGLDEGLLGPRHVVDSDIPDNAIVTDPTRNTWAVLDERNQIIDTGTTWQCGYCSWRTQCLMDGAGRPSAAVAVTIEEDDERRLRGA